MFASDGKDSAPLEDLLAAHADSLIAGLTDFAPQLERYSVAQAAEATQLLDLAQRLRESLVPVAPSDEFIERLKGEFVGEPQLTLLVRWRKLPAHYQLAAKLGGLTLTAGIVLLAARRALTILGAMQHRNHAESDKGLTLNTAS